MMHRSTTGGRAAKRVLLSLLASVCLLVGSPVVAASSAATGAQTPVSAAHGDCKNDNNGKHFGYVCPRPAPVTSTVTVPAPAPDPLVLVN
jgi:hypothetical protein